MQIQLLAGSHLYNERLAILKEELLLLEEVEFHLTQVVGAKLQVDSGRDGSPQIQFIRRRGNISKFNLGNGQRGHFLLFIYMYMVWTQ